jgi:hypothetical protein
MTQKLGRTDKKVSGTSMIICGIFPNLYNAQMYLIVAVVVK